MAFVARATISRVGETMARSKKHSGFTLVELLAVVVIIGLMITISIPSLHRITVASALGSGTRQFSDQVAMARTYALVNAQDVYLVVAYHDTWAANTTLSNTYCYVAYGFCVSAVSPLLRSVAPLSKVSYIDAIQYLPPGAVFCDQVSNITNSLVPFPNSTNTPVAVWCVKINKYGQIPPLASPPQLSLMQGFVSGYGAATLPQGTFRGTNTVTINPLTGKAMVTKS